jgi:hypothetical protein
MSGATGDRTDDELRLVHMLGLRKGIAAIEVHCAFTEHEQKRIAGEILVHLRLSNYTIAPGGQPAPRHRHRNHRGKRRRRHFSVAGR